MRQTCLLNCCSWLMEQLYPAESWKNEEREKKSSSAPAQQNFTMQYGNVYFLEQTRPSAQFLWTSISSIWLESSTTRIIRHKESKPVPFVSIFGKAATADKIQTMCFNFTFEQFLASHSISGWKMISKWTNIRTVPQKQKIWQKKRLLTAKPWGYVYCVSRPSALGKERSFMCYLLSLGRPSFCNKTCMSPWWTPSSPTESGIEVCPYPHASQKPLGVAMEGRNLFSFFK